MYSITSTSECAKKKRIEYEKLKEIFIEFELKATFPSFGHVKNVMGMVSGKLGP